jgi:nucleotide-binding universal stress UspA family protein
MRLLVAIDGTDASDDALDYALDLAVRLDASLRLTYVVEPAVRVTADEESTRGLADADEEHDTQFVRGALEDARTTGDRILREAANRADAVGVTAETRLVDGDPLEELAALAGEPSVDGIVVGHRDARNGTDRGEGVDESVAKGLLDRSPVPVTVVT